MSHRGEIGPESTMHIGVKAIGASGGTAHRLRELPVDERSLAARELLQEDGYDCYLASSRPIADLVAEAAAECLHRAAVPVDEVQAVIVGTQSFWDCTPGSNASISAVDHDRVGEPILDALRRAGLVNAQPFGTWLASCANFGAGLAIAQALLAGRHYPNALVVLADRAPTPSSRIAENATALYSDAAAACLLTREASPLRLLNVVGHSAVQLIAGSESLDCRSQNEEFAREMGLFASKIQAATGRSLQEFSILLADNLHGLFLGMVCDALSIDPSCVLTPSKPQVAHAYAADCLLSLRQLIDTKALNVGDRVGLLNLGTATFYFVDIEVLPGAAG